MAGSVRLGRVAGIVIQAHWSTLVTVGLLTWLLGAAILPSELPGHSTTAGWLAAPLGAVGLLISLLAHEFAHCVVARRHGIRVNRITLWLFGGMSELADDSDDPKADLRIAIAGPLTSAALGITIYGIATALSPWARAPGVVVLMWLAVTNVALAIFNLLPGAPLDGGRVLRAIIWRRTGDRSRATAAAARSGHALGTAMIVLGVAELLVLHNVGGAWLMFLGWFLRAAADTELAAASTRHRLDGIRVYEVMTDHPVAVPLIWTVDEFLRSGDAMSRHRALPVVDADNRPIGTLRLADLAEVPQSQRGTTAIEHVTRPLPAAAHARENELLTSVLTRAVPRTGLDLVTVVDDGDRLVGVVTAADLVHACDRGALGLPIADQRTGQGK